MVAHTDQRHHHAAVVHRARHRHLATAHHHFLRRLSILGALLRASDGNRREKHRARGEHKSNRLHNTLLFIDDSQLALGRGRDLAVTQLTDAGRITPMIGPTLDRLIFGPTPRASRRLSTARRGSYALPRNNKARPPARTPSRATAWPAQTAPPHARAAAPRR